MPRPRALIPVATSAVLAAAVWLVTAPAGFLNYDTAYALLWGNDLVHGRTPDYDVPFAPTPHPLATLVGMLSSEAVFEVLAFVALGVLGWLVFALGRTWFNVPAGILAAAIVLTREPIFSYGVRAYVDIPYICLLLGALLVETRRARAGTPVLVLIALAGLLRPEAWLFAFAYCVWLWRGGALSKTHIALLVAAPLLWSLSDLLITGNPLHSLTGTRDTAADLGRVTGLQHVPTTLPRRLGEILREPVLLATAIGGVLSLWRLRDRRGVVLGAAAGVLAVLAFCLLATAGLSILTRYLLLPATILAIFAGGGVFGWLELDPETDGAWRTRWLALAALTAVAMLAFVPSQVNRIKNTRSALVAQTKILDELHTLVTDDPIRCRPITVPNRRAVPQLALWTDTRPSEIVSAQEAGSWPGTAFAPASPAIADQFVLDARDKDRSLPDPPPEVNTLGGRYWDRFEDCGPRVP
ncbi:hypothetical protein [Baekduia sp. Peel2402]|uniref:hypothetical protein n=1 Tax=Baekduia sp. Peel2402 TaxID=3458296 RepID=UPI00403ECD80